MNDKQSFEYSYSAKQQEEIASIRKKYIVEEDKMETLRKLDKSVEQGGTIISIILGVVGTLIMGGGMSLCLVWTDYYMILGIILGVIGIVLIAMAYPVYQIIVKKRREKIAPQILALIEELMK